MDKWTKRTEWTKWARGQNGQVDKMDKMTSGHGDWMIDNLYKNDKRNMTFTLKILGCILTAHLADTL